VQGHHIWAIQSVKCAEDKQIRWWSSTNRGEAHYPFQEQVQVLSQGWATEDQ